MAHQFYLSIIQHLRRFTIASLLLALIFRCGVIEPFKILPALSQSLKKPSTDLAKAQQELEKALEDLKTNQVLGQPDFIAFAQANVGSAYTKLGEYEKAEKYFIQAIALSKTFENPQFKPFIFFEYGQFHTKQKKYDLAIKLYQQAGNFAKQSGNKDVEANIFQQLGTTAFIAKKYPEATQALYTSVDAFDAIV